MTTEQEIATSPPGWTHATLNELVKCSWGNTSLTKEAYCAKGYTAFSASGPDGFVEQFEHQGEGIVLSAIGARCGRCFLADGNWTAIKNTITFTNACKTTTDLKFLYFYLNRAGVWPTRGAGQPFIGLNDARALNIPLPPLNEQRRIVAKIEELSARSRAGKEALDAIPPLLERFRQSVLAAAFRGDLTKQWREQNPNVEPASVLLDRIRQERRHRWEQDYLAQQKAKGKTPKDDKWKEKYQEPKVDLGDDDWFLRDFVIPDSWEWVSLESVGDLSTGKTPSTTSSEYWGNGLPFLTPSEVHPQGNILAPKRFVTALGAKQSRVLPSGATVIVCIGTVGKVGLTDRSVVFNQQMNAIVPCASLDRKYLFYWCKALYPWIVRNASATVNAAILNKGRLGTAPIPLPPVAEQLKIVEALNDAFSTADGVAMSLRYKAVRMATLDQSILAKAFRGELVPQDPNDEPASALLERIRADRANNESKGTGRKRSKS